MDIREYFSVDLIVAINRWMLTPTAEVANLIDKAAVNLPAEFKTRETSVYRCIALGKTHIWQLLGEQSLAEKISSWTLSEVVAKTFDGGVPPIGWQGVIFRVTPDRGRTVLNISKLFSCDDFNLAVREYRSFVPNIEYGIDEFNNSECEVIVELDYLYPEEIYSLGGYSASEEEIIQMSGREIYGHPPLRRRASLPKKLLGGLWPKIRCKVDYGRASKGRAIKDK